MSVDLQKTFVASPPGVVVSGVKRNLSVQKGNHVRTDFEFQVDGIMMAVQDLNQGTRCQRDHHDIEDRPMVSSGIWGRLYAPNPPNRYWRKRVEARVRVSLGSRLSKHCKVAPFCKWLSSTLLWCVVNSLVYIQKAVRASVCIIS